MAAYAKVLTLSQLVRKIESWHNTIDKIMLQALLELINTEFAAMESAGLAAYTVTSGLLASMKEEVINKCNVPIERTILENVAGLFVAECDAVEAGGLAYTKTVGLAKSMKENVQNYPNVENRINLHLIIDLIDGEFDQVVLAS